MSVVRWGLNHWAEKTKSVPNIVRRRFFECSLNLPVVSSKTGKTVVAVLDTGISGVLISNDKLTTLE